MADFDLETLQAELARRETEPWVLPRADQVNPELRSRFEDMARDFHEQTGYPLRVTDTFRSREEQADVFRRKPNLAVAPGKSRHEYGDALDIDQSQVPTLEKLGLIDKYGFHRPALSKGERWHLELPRFEKASKIAATQDYSLEDLQAELARREGQPPQDFSLEDLQGELARRAQDAQYETDFQPVGPSPKDRIGPDTPAPLSQFSPDTQKILTGTDIRSLLGEAPEKPFSGIPKEYLPIVAGTGLGEIGEAAKDMVRRQPESVMIGAPKTVPAMPIQVDETAKGTASLIPSSEEARNIGARRGFQMEPDFRERPPEMREEKVRPVPLKIIRPPRPGDEALYAAPPEKSSLGIQMAEAIGSIMPDISPAMGGQEVVRPGGELSFRAAPEGTPRRQLPQREEIIKTAPAEMSAENIGKKFAAGVVGTTGGTATGLSWLISDTSPLLKKAQPALKAVAESAERYTKQTDPGEMGFAGDVAAGVGSMGLFFIPGYGGAMLSAKAAKTITPRIANALGIGVMAAGEAIAEAGDAWQHVRDKGLSKEEADRLAGQVFTANLPLLIITERLGLFGEHGNRVRRVLFSGIMEGAQEAGQSVIPQVARGEPVNAKDAIYQGLIGATIGVAAGGGTKGMGAEPQRIDKFMQSILPSKEADKFNRAIIQEFKNKNPNTYGYSDKEVFDRLSENPEELSDIIEKAVPKGQKVPIPAPDVEKARQRFAAEKGIDPETMIYKGSEDGYARFDTELHGKKTTFVVEDETTLPIQPPPPPAVAAPPEVATTPPVTAERPVEAKGEMPTGEISAKRKPTPKIGVGGTGEEIKPWELTKKEFAEASNVIEHPDKIRANVFWLGEGDKGIPVNYGGNVTTPAKAREYIHKSQIEKALARGENIPEAVLKDYPDLQPTPAPAKEGVAPAKGRGAKEPWEMTLTEFRNMPRPDPMGKSGAMLPKPSEKAAKIAHGDYVAEALESGKPVPPAVLADYPDLAAKYEARLPRTEGVKTAKISKVSVYDPIGAVEENDTRALAVASGGIDPKSVDLKNYEPEERRLLNLMVVRKGGMGLDDLFDNMRSLYPGQFNHFTDAHDWVRSLLDGRYKKGLTRGGLEAWVNEQYEREAKNYAAKDIAEDDGTAKREVAAEALESPEQWPKGLTVDNFWDNLEATPSLAIPKTELSPEANQIKRAYPDISDEQASILAQDPELRKQIAKGNWKAVERARAKGEIQRPLDMAGTDLFSGATKKGRTYRDRFNEIFKEEARGKGSDAKDPNSPTYRNVSSKSFDRLKAEYPEINSFGDFDKPLPTEPGAGKGKKFSVKSPAPAFYSQLSKTVEASLPNRGPGEQLAQTLESWAKKGQFKADELKWSGVLPWLREQKGPVTKEQVLEKLQEGMVEVREVRRGHKIELPNNHSIKSYQKGYALYNGNIRTEFKGASEQEVIRDAIDAGYLPKTSPKFQSFLKLPPGGENYREVLLTVPDKPLSFEEWSKPLRSPESIAFSGEVNEESLRKGYEQYVSFGSPYNMRNAFNVPSGHAYGDTAADVNRFAHIFMDDRVIDGKKYLTVWEMQSDWAAKGRREGFQGDIPKIGGKFLGRQQELERIPDVEGQPRGVIRVKDSLRNEFYLPIAELKEGAPPLPFAKNWHEVALKKTLRMAAEEGYDGIAWATGDMVKERYDLSKHVDRVEVLKRPDDSAWTVRGIKDGDSVLGTDISSLDKLDEVIGKEPAEKLRQKISKSTNEYDPVSISGLDLKIGGEWANRQYDQMMPQFLNKYAKQWGARVGDVKFNQLEQYKSDVIESARNNNANLADVKKALDHIIEEPLDTEKRPTGWAWKVLDDATNGKVDLNRIHDIIDSGAAETTEQLHTLPITPAMRESVLYKGQPLFKEKEHAKAVEKVEASAEQLVTRAGGRPSPAEVHTAGRRLLEDVKSRGRQDAAKNGEPAGFWDGIEYSQDFAESSEFKQIHAIGKRHGVAVLPVKNLPTDGVWFPGKTPVILIDQAEGVNTRLSIGRHEVFHHRYDWGDQTAKDLVELVNRKSPVFSDYKDSLRQGYDDVGLPLPSDEAIAQEIAADYVSKAKKYDVNGYPLSLARAFNNPLKANSLRSKYEVAGPVAKGIGVEKEPKFMAKKPPPESEKGAVGFDIRGPKPPKDPELAAAQEKVSSRISRDEHIEKEPIKAGQIYTSLVDRLHPLKKLMDRYASKPSVVGKDIYKQARLFVGWHGKAEAFIDYHPFDRKSFEFDTEAKSLKEIVKPLEEQGRLQDFDDFLVARRAIEREAKGFKTGVDLEAAQTVVDKLGPEFKGAAKDFDTYMDSLLRYMRDSQMISPERYQQIKANSLDYAPFMRLFEPEKAAGGGKGYEARQIIKAFKGSERKIISPLESAVKLTYGMVNASERNQVGLSLIGWAKEAGALGKEVNAIPPKRFPVEVTMKEILRDPEIKKLLEESGLSQEEATIFRPSAFRPAENVISVWENGKRKFYEVPKDVADIIQGLDQSTVDIWMRVMSAPAQALRLGATTLSPEFGLRNFFKDQFPAFIHSKYGYKPLIDFMRGVTDIAQGSEDYWKYMISGAPHAELVSMDRRMLQKKLNEITSGKLTMPGFLVRHPIEAMKILSEYSEMGTRLGEFKKGIDQGADIQEAGFAARELTTDFGRKGNSLVAKAINLLTAFWNANIQGLDRVVRAHKDNPFGTMVKSIAAITIPSLLLEMAFHDDDRYQNLPWWRKDLFYNIPTAIGVVSLPKPWTYGLLYGSIPQRIVNSIMTKNPHAFDKLATAIGRELPDFPVPTGIKPFIETWANKSFFFDRPIVPTWKEQLPPKYQYGEWNSEVAKQVGNIISKIPAIGDTKAASPAVLDHFVMSWTGGAGRIALNAVDYGLRKAGAVHAVPRPTRVLADYPVVRAFISRYPSADAQPIKDFYDNIKEFQSKKQALKQIGSKLAMQGRKDELSSLIKEMQPEASLNLTNMQKAVSNAHKYIDRVNSHPNMNPDQKRETIERTYLSIINMTKKVNMTLDKVKARKQGASK